MVFILLIFGYDTIEWNAGVEHSYSYSGKAFIFPAGFRVLLTETEIT